MTPTVDTNIFVATVDGRDPIRQGSAQAIASALKAGGWPVAKQVCAEFDYAMIRRLKLPREVAARATRNLMRAYPTFGTNKESTVRANIESLSGALTFYEANLLSAAELAGCTHFISDDIEEGFRIGRLEVVQAFEHGQPSQRTRELLGF